jgi:hypothetical protein
MPMYRIHTPISQKDRMLYPGTITRLSYSEEKIAALVLVGAISPVHGPPLSILPGWSTRAKQLEPIGIITAEQFLDADEKELAKALALKVDTIRKYKQELETAWLTAPDGNG